MGLVRFILLGISFLLAGCGAVYVSSRDSMENAEGQYRIIAPLYLFSELNTNITNRKFLGINDNSNEYRARILPTQVSQKFIGYENKGSQIIDVIPVGSVFEVRYIRTQRYVGGESVTYMGEIHGVRNYRDVSTTFIQNGISENTSPVIAEELMSKIY